MIKRLCPKELRSAVSVEQAWKDVFPSRAALLGGFRRASGGTKGPYDGGPGGVNS